MHFLIRSYVLANSYLYRFSNKILIIWNLHRSIEFILFLYYQKKDEVTNMNEPTKNCLVAKPDRSHVPKVAAISSCQERSNRIVAVFRQLVANVQTVGLDQCA